MDPAAHTLTGAALAAAGLRRVTPLATAALILGANAPDVDAVLLLIDEPMALAYRRGWTHGVLGILVLPFFVAGLLLAWDRLVRLRRRPQRRPARAGPLLALSVLGVATHPLLDWLNNYGMRWLMPFDESWTYGDALFILDPWVWLALGGVVFLVSSRHPAALAAWLAAWLLASLLILTSPLAPTATRVLWVAGLGVILAARFWIFAPPGRAQALERTAQVAVAAVTVYMVVNLGASHFARAQVQKELEAQGIGPITELMVGPVPANPFQGFVMAATPDAYHFGAWHWLTNARLHLEGSIETPLPRDPVVEAAVRTQAAQRFLAWARFPYVEIQADEEGYLVRFDDARYDGLPGLAGGRGPTVRLDSKLEPVAP